MTPKTDCFGYKQGKCTVLTELFCAKEKCAFYKTKEQYNSDREKAEKNIGRGCKMKCPVCGGESKVYDSIPDCEAVYRKRRCLECNHVWFTEEYESDGEYYKEYASYRRRKYKYKRGS